MSADNLMSDAVIPREPFMPTVTLSPDAAVTIAGGEVVTWKECLRRLAASTPVGGWEGSRPQEAVPTEQAEPAVVAAPLPQGGEDLGYVAKQVVRIILALEPVIDLLPDEFCEEHSDAFNALSEALETVSLEGLRQALAQPAGGCPSNEGAA
jgi:hypothetical protein